jgi:hypothetical protein
MRARLCLLVLVLVSQAAPAQSRSVSHSDWLVTRDQVTVREVIPASEARRLKSADLPAPTNEELAAYMLNHLAVMSRGSACEAIDQGYDLGRVNTLAVGPGLYGFEIIFHCRSATPPVLINSVLEQAFGHIDYAYIEMDGARSQHLFTAGHSLIDLSANPPAAGFSTYATIGMRHVMRSGQSLCFLLGLALLIKSRRDGWMVAGALSGGYAAALLIPAAGWVPRMPALESSIGLLVALCATHWVARRMDFTYRAGISIAAAMALVAMTVWRGMGEIPWTLLGAAALSASLLILSARRPLAALIGLPLSFGLLDGMVLAGDYVRLQLWPEFGVWPQMSFNLGALSMELGIMALLIGGKMGWGRSRQRAIYGPVAEEVAATALAGLGAFWLVIQLTS